MMQTFFAYSLRDPYENRILINVDAEVIKIQFISWVVYRAGQTLKFSNVQYKGQIAMFANSVYEAERCSTSYETVEKSCISMRRVEGMVARVDLSAIKFTRRFAKNVELITRRENNLHFGKILDTFRN